MRNLALFDFDDTLIKGDSILYFRSFLLTKFPFLWLFLPIQVLAVILTGLKITRAEWLKKIILWPYAFVPNHKKETFLSEFAEQIWPSKTLNKPFQELLKHLEQKDEVVIVSASYQGYLDYFQKYFPGVKIIGTSVSWEGPFKFPVYGKPGNLKKENKVVELKKQGIWDEEKFQKSKVLPKVYAYSDSHTDIPMLELASFKIGVQPNPKLKKYLKQYKDSKIICQESEFSRRRGQFAKGVSLLTGYCGLMKDN